jgi:hypothetical protein
MASSSKIVLSISEGGSTKQKIDQGDEERDEGSF